MNNIERQIEFLKEYGVKNNYTIEGDKLIINGGLDLSRLTSCHKDFLKGVVINGYLYLNSLTSCHKDFLNGSVIYGNLYLNSLTSCHKDFLKNTKINGFLDLPSLTSCHKDFLKGATINGGLFLNSLTSCHEDFLKSTIFNGFLDLHSLTSCDKDFLKGATINGFLDLSSLISCDKDFLKDIKISGSLYLRSLTSCHKDFLKGVVINGCLYLNSLTKKDSSLLENNVKKIVRGYNQEKGYCYFDRILSKVLNVSNKFGYVIYETPFEYVAQKGDFTAHGKTIKKAIQDLEFKILSDKIKNEPIYEDTLVTVEKYRIITGACELGCKNFMEKNNIEFTYENDVLKEISPITVKELLPILEKNNAYGLEKFKSLVK